MYFNLNNNCYLVKGETNSVIYNVGTADLVELSEEETRILCEAQHHDTNPDTAPFLHELATMGWGFFSPRPCFIDKLRPYSRITLTRADLRPPLFDTAFLQLTNYCGQPAEKCRTQFCTPCRTHDNEAPWLSTEQWKQTIDHLRLAKAGNIILTGGDVTLHPGLSDIIDYLFQQQQPFNVVLTPFARHPEKISKEIPIQVYTCHTNDIPGLKEKFSRFQSVHIIHTSPLPSDERNRPASGPHFTYTYSPVNPQITPDSLSPCTLEKFFRRKDFNDCLKGKMFINYQGDIIPCFQASHLPIGNIHRENFDEIYRRLIIHYWNAPHIHARCQTCEWYYACPVCTFANPEETCHYQKAKAEWK